MKTIIVWYLVSFGGNGSHYWSPPLPSAEECYHVQKLLNERNYANNTCVRLEEVVK